ncbi:MAG: D-alanyl-D-alanine carboxypeptidase/D-alanyl-D-alanine-endopeptidase [Myxococcota bacterium]|nr:D-alanyl-D-alanine carboxypeptidase/D-alanyl-D-alanine-endopeptidase [Myxococcota bacterium]
MLIDHRWFFTLCLVLIGPAPTIYAKSTGDPQLVNAIDALLKRQAVKSSSASILLVHLDDDRVLYAHQPDLKLHPASNTKLMTTAVALQQLGPTYRWQTQLAADKFEGGTAQNLYFIGQGDPYFVSESLWKLVDDARFNGLKIVTGDLVIDDTRFSGPVVAPGFDDKDQDSAYRAASGAASINFNAVVIRIRPAKKSGQTPQVDVRPDSGYIEVVNRATTTRRGKERLKLRASAFEDRTKIVLEGTIPMRHAGLTVRRRIDRPTMYLGMALKLFLKNAGIDVKGKIRTGKVISRPRRLARLRSRNLADVISVVNKTSNNFMAEHLVLTLGAEKGRAGNWTEGNRVVSNYLKQVIGLSDFKYVNGSGLFGDTRFSARDFVQVLAYMSKMSPELTVYENSLAVSGVDGTLRRRLKALKPRTVRGKTGTLNGVICLSGYLTFADGSRGAFSLLMNDLKGAPWSVWPIHDKIIQTFSAFKPTLATTKKTKATPVP